MEAAKKELRGNIEKYLGRAEKIKGFVKDERDGEYTYVCVMCMYKFQATVHIFVQKMHGINCD